MVVGQAEERVCASRRSVVVSGDTQEDKEGLRETARRVCVCEREFE